MRTLANSCVRSITSKTSDCHLLACPPEIRTLIYRYVLTFEHPLTHTICEATPVDLAFLQVCKAVEREAAPQFYQVNQFVIKLDQPRYDRRTRSSAALIASGQDPNLSCLPARHIISIRNVMLVKSPRENHPRDTSFVPFGSPLHNASTFSNVEIKNAINAFISRKTLLNSLSITLQGGHGMTPLSGLREGVFEAVTQLANLKSLELWRSRYYKVIDNETRFDWADLGRKDLEEARDRCFPRAIAVSSSQRAKWVDSEIAFRVEHGLLINFARQKAKICELAGS